MDDGTIIEIRVHTLPEPVKVAYHTVRTSVPDLLFSSSSPPSPNNKPQDASHAINPTDSLHPRNESAIRRGSSDGGSEGKEGEKERRVPNYDAVLFIGMAQTISHYMLERLAHRDGYNKEDVDDKFLEDPDLWRENGSPPILYSGFDVDHVVGLWKGDVPVSEERSGKDRNSNESD